MVARMVEKFTGFKPMALIASSVAAALALALAGPVAAQSWTLPALLGKTSKVAHLWRWGGLA